MFFGALYAGIWPVPLPLPTSFGGKEAYIDQLAVQLKSADPALLVYPPELLMAGAAAEATGRRRRSTGSRFFAEPAEPAPLDQPTRRRHRLSPIFERLDPLPARRRRSPTARCSATSPPTPIR